MFLRVPNLLNAEQLDEIDEALAQATFVDGSRTAGPAAQSVKNNLQADPASLPQLESLVEIIVGALARHPVIRSAVMPTKVLPPLFSKYEAGMAYGDHTDNAIMGRRRLVRTDVSVTIFLSDPSTYTGGELKIQGPAGPMNIKLPRGDAILYPGQDVHSVERVTSGVRLAAVTWIQSMIADSAQRQIVNDLDTASRLVSETAPNSPEANLLLKTYSNLVRMWGDV